MKEVFICNSIEAMEITQDWRAIEFKKIVQLYESVGWSVYTKDQGSLFRAYSESSFVLIAKEGDKVVGALRSLSDEVPFTICKIF